MPGPRPARKAFASTSLGQRQSTFLSVTFILSHIGTKQSTNCWIPRKNIVEYWKDSPCFLPRPKNHASHGTIVATFGIPFASHWSATGFVTSGVDDDTTRPTLSLKMRSRATADARLESDWLSLTTISTGRVFPPVSYTHL